MGADAIAAWLRRQRENGAGMLQALPRGGLLRTSYAQRGMWLAHKINDPSSAFAMRHSYRLRGPLDVGALNGALQALVRRHETFRTHFVERDGSLLQRISPTGFGGMTIEHVLSEDNLRSRMANLVREAFDLERGPLFRARLYCVGDEDHVLLIVVHHITNDAWSMGVLHRDLSELYAALVEERPPALPVLRVQYADFAEWQLVSLDDGDAAEHEAYWERRLAGAPDPLPLPLDRPRPIRQSFRGDWLTFAIDPGLYGRVERLARSENASVFMVLLATFQTLLASESQTRDIVVGTATSVRPFPETQDLVGPFTNTLPLRTAINEDLSFRRLLLNVRRTVLDAHEHDEYPFERVVERLSRHRSLRHNPLVQVSLSSHHGLVTPLDLRGVAVEVMPTVDVDIQRDLTLYVSTSGGAATGTFGFATDLFDRATVARLAIQFTNLLDRVTAEPDGLLAVLGVSITSPRAPSSDDAVSSTPLETGDRVLDDPSTPIDSGILDAVRSVWCEVLGVDDVDEASDFFALGGGSIAAMKAAMRLTDRTGARVPVRAVFEHQRLGELAQFLQKRAGTACMTATSLREVT